MPLKTFHFTNAWHQSSGGIATFYRALIDAANRKGHFIRLVVPGEADHIEEVGEFGRIYHVQGTPAFLNTSYRMIYPPQFLWPGSKLQRILRSERPDLVEVCDKYTLNYLGALLRLRLLKDVDFRPVVVGMSCERMDDNFRTYLRGVPFAQKFCGIYMNWLYFPFFDHHIVNSEYTAQELRVAAQGHVVPRGTWIRHMGVDLTHFSAERKSPAVRRQLLNKFENAADDAALLLYVGRLVPEKNLTLLFDLLGDLASRGNRDYRLLVAGEGIERSHWEKVSAERYPGRVVFLGHSNDRDFLADLYANADCFVHPNPREPFGIAPLEAMASGLPLVAPNRGGVTSYANPENAWTVDANVQSFSAAVEEVLGSAALVNFKTAEAFATAQRYRWENVAASFLDLYADLYRAQQQYAALPRPEFASTPARGIHAALIHGISRSARGIFELLASLAAKRAQPMSSSSPRSPLELPH